MALGDYLLRIVARAGFTTKAAALTLVEGDDNALILLDALVELNNPGSGVPAYDPATAYAGTAYVSYDSKLWKHIGGAVDVGVTPGTDPTKWTQVSISALAHEPSTGDDLLTFSVDIPSAEILALNTTPKVLATPSAGKAIELVSVRAEMLWSGGAISYATQTTLQIIANGADRAVASVTNLLTATKRQSVVMGLANGQVDQTQLITDATLLAKVATADPTAGDFDIKISGIYREITLEP